MYTYKTHPSAFEKCCIQLGYFSGSLHQQESKATVGLKPSTSTVPALRLDRIMADQSDGMSWHQGDVFFMVFGCTDMFHKHTIEDCCCDTDTGTNYVTVYCHKFIIGRRLEK
jgi:hypothetical protein